MNLRTYRTLQALILGGLGIFLFSKVVDGRILFYINQRFVILVFLAAIMLILLAQLVLRERPSVQEEEVAHPHHDHAQDGHEHGGNQRQGWALFLLALPVLIGVLVPNRSLSASAVAMRGINTSSNLSVSGGSAQTLEIPSNERSILDWLRLFNETSDGESLSGQEADVTGFVYHDARLGADQFMVGRFTIACCVADAAALGMVVDWPEAAELPDSRWVRVRGLVGLTELEGSRLPMIEAQSVEFIPEPEQPYIFP
jgi:putative membrane protein